MFIPLYKVEDLYTSNLRSLEISGSCLLTLISEQPIIVIVMGMSCMELVHG